MKIVTALSYILDTRLCGVYLEFQFRVQHESTIKYKSIIFMDQITYFPQPLISLKATD